MSPILGTPQPMTRVIDLPPAPFTGRAWWEGETGGPPITSLAN